MNDFLTLKGGEVDVGGAPEVISVLPFGHVVSQKGEFDVDEESLAAMKEQIAQRGVDLVVDYRHRREHRPKDLSQPIQRGDQVPHPRRRGEGLDRHRDRRSGERGSYRIFGKVKPPSIHAGEDEGDVVRV